MRGYLERLSSSVLKPGGTIHPILTPIYSSEIRANAEDYEQEIAPRLVQPARQVTHDESVPALAHTAETVPPPESDAAPPPPNADAKLYVPSQKAPEPEPPGLAAPAKPEPKIFTRTTPDEPQSVTPLTRRLDEEDRETRSPHSDPSSQEPAELPHPAQPYEINITAESVRSVPVHAEAAPRPTAMPVPESRPVSSAAADSKPTKEEHTSAIVFQDRFTPLITKPMLPERPERAPAISMAPVSDARKEQSRPIFEMRKQLQREPDEIQIHIGRIEVTAVPPPQAPRARKPENRQISLDEYLKSSHGGT